MDLGDFGYVMVFIVFRSLVNADFDGGPAVFLIVRFAQRPKDDLRAGGEHSEGRVSAFSWIEEEGGEGRTEALAQVTFAEG